MKGHLFTLFFALFLSYNLLLSTKQISAGPISSNSNGDEEGTYHRVCGKLLLDTLKRVCDHNYIKPSEGKFFPKDILSISASHRLFKLKL